VVATSIPNTYSDKTGKGTGLYGAVQFQLFAPHETAFLNYERSVSATNDGGQWSFGADGTVQPFEELETYQKRKIIDRFTPDMLKRYCYALGIRVDSPDFYGPRSVLISSSDPLPADWPKLSLGEVRHKMGLGPHIGTS
jgi:hypothetical protein